MLRKEVRTKRLVLRPLRPSDYLVWFDCWVNRLPSQSKWDSGPKTSRQCSRAYFNKVVARHNKLSKNDDYYWFGVFEKKSGHLIGGIDFDVFVRSTHQFANFGYVIYNRYWGHGYGQEAAAAGLKIGFTQLKLNRLEAAINLDNRKSICLAKAIGMTKEGIKKRYWFENGKWVDHLIYVANPENIGLKPQKPF
ncbi:MAG: GNAT family N-acetyltransferase [Pseudobdellovibrionaceae bacterium]